MKKNLLVLIGLGLLSYSTLSAQFTVTDLNVEVQHTDVSLVDFDGDGDLDLVVSGENQSQLQVLLNDGIGHFSPIATPPPFTQVTRTTFDWGDINGDGKIDMIESGFSGNGPFAGIYTSNGTGTYTAYNGVTLPQIATSTGFADLNNDGYTDIFIFGNFDIGAAKDTRAKIYFNNKNGGFTESAQFQNYKFIDPNVTVVDFDNDGDLDLFVSGYENISDKRFSQIFVNVNGVFTAHDFGFIPKGQGSSIWGDYDGDGFLDLLLNGDGYVNSGEDNDHIYRLYHNNAGASFTAATTFSNYRQNSTGDGGRFVDWDNDGDLDIIVTGDNKAGSQRTGIYINNSGTFTPLAENDMLPGVSESSIEVADVDNDGDLDLILTGYSNNDFDGSGTAGPFNKNVTLLITNNSSTANTAPTAPTNLSVTGNQTSLMLNWATASDGSTPQNSLSYNLFLVDQSGKWFYYPLSDTTTGKLGLQKMGNANLNKSWVVKGLPAGTYRWGVQAVDNGFMGSEFAKSSFTINADGSLPVHLNSYAAKAEGGKSKIEWSTASEQNNSKFVVERSSNGRQFFKLATVAGKGTTGSSNAYSVIDNNPSAGINYYRLTQVDIDGRPSDFGVRTVNFNSGNAAKVSAYPNPAKSVLGIRLSDYKGTQLEISLTDMMGKVVHREVIKTENGQGYYQLHLNNKPTTGQYSLQVIGQDFKQALKIIVE